MKTFSFLFLILVLTFSCKKEDTKPEVVIVPQTGTIQTDTTITDTTKTDIPPIFEPTCPIDINSYEFDTLGFEIIDSKYIYAEFIPSSTIKGWSFEEYQGGDVEVIASGGECTGKCNNSIVAKNGFDRSCGLVGCWYTYISYIMEDNSSSIVSDSASLKSFFGDIDTKDEAVFWAYVNGYKLNYSTKDPRENGIKKVDFGYELKTYKTVGSGCGSVVIRTAYHIHICPEGQITILSEEELFNEIVYTCWD